MGDPRDFDCPLTGKGPAPTGIAFKSDGVARPTVSTRLSRRETAAKAAHVLKSRIWEIIGHSLRRKNPQ